VYMSFLPKLFADRGWDPAAYGAMAGTFMFTAAIGNVVAGDIADRFGMRAATLWPLLLSVPAGLACVWAPTPALAFVGSAVAGMLIGGQHSVLVVHAQRLLPVKQGFAAGLILGFTFASGGVGTWLAGLAADVVGLPATMQWVTLLALPAALLALTLPGREVAAPAPEPASA
jgi:MFS transporter, FSR family, fosmidomycin resistance protein